MKPKKINKLKLKLQVWWQFKMGNIRLWFDLQKRLLQLWWAGAPKWQKHLEKGAYHFRRGAIYQVGQPFHINNRTYFIENLYYNFRLGKVTHRLSRKGIPESELFRGKPTKLMQEVAKK